MADYVGVTIRIHGKIETVEQFSQIEEALKLHDFQPYEAERNGSTALHLLTSASPINPTAAKFYSDYVRYGDIEDAREILERSGISYSVETETGCETAAIAYSWTQAEELEVVKVYEGAPVITVEELIKLAEQNGADTALQIIKNRTGRATGRELAPLELSEGLKLALMGQLTHS